MARGRIPAAIWFYATWSLYPRKRDLRDRSAGRRCRKGHQSRHHPPSFGYQVLNPRPHHGAAPIHEASRVSYDVREFVRLAGLVEFVWTIGPDLETV